MMESAIARQLLQITVTLRDSDLSSQVRDQEAAALYDLLQPVAGDAVLSYVITAGSDSAIANPGEPKRIGIQAVGLPVEQLRPLMQTLCDRMVEHPLDTLVELLVGATRLQSQTRQGEELLALVPVVEQLLPPVATYRAQAEKYARQGEFSPVARANLVLLRHQLDLSIQQTDSIDAKALGPFKTRQEKINRYQQVFADELSRSSMLDDATRRELQRFRDAMGLSYDDVIEVENALKARHQPADTQIQTNNTQVQPDPAPAAPSAPPPPDPEAEYRLNLDRYRQEFQLIAQHSLFPSDFDQGRLEQARRIWQLSEADTSKIHREIIDNVYGSIASDCGVDYSRLRQLLLAGQLQDADIETERVMLLAAGQDMCPLDGEALRQFPITDIVTIDRLWSRYSQQRFGFLCQQAIYERVAKSPFDFFSQIGWRRQGLWKQGRMNWDLLSRGEVKAYRELTFHPDAPWGHLPTWRWACGSLESGYSPDAELLDAFFSRFEYCSPDEATLVPLPEILPNPDDAPEDEAADAVDDPAGVPTGDVPNSHIPSNGEGA
jgi:hypothetical protein